MTEYFFFNFNTILHKIQLKQNKKKCGIERTYSTKIKVFDIRQLYVQKELLHTYKNTNDLMKKVQIHSVRNKETFREIKCYTIIGQHSSLYLGTTLFNMLSKKLQVINTLILQNFYNN